MARAARDVPAPVSRGGRKKTGELKQGVAAVAARNRALGILGLTMAQVDEVPRIRHITASVGDSARLLEFLSGSEEPEARAVVEQSLKLSPAQLRETPIEALCVAAEIPTRKLLGVLTSAVAEQQNAATMLLSKAMHPKIVQATVDAALLPDGTNDRRMLHLAEQFIPVPKTAITYNRQVLIDNRQQTAVAILPPVEQAVQRMSERFIAAAPTQAMEAEEIPDSDD